MNDRTISDRLRDSLAEALYCGSFNQGGWEFAPAQMVFGYRQMAERVLAALPSVGLTLSIQPHQNDGGEG